MGAYWAVVGDDCCCCYYYKHQLLRLLLPLPVVGRLAAVDAGRGCGALTPGAEAVTDNLAHALGEVTGTVVAARSTAMPSWVSPSASSAANIEALEQRRRAGSLASAAGDRASHPAVTGREATSVAYSHAWCTCCASWSALSRTMLPSTHWPSSTHGSPSLDTEEVTLVPSRACNSPPAKRSGSNSASLGCSCCCCCCCRLIMLPEKERPKKP